MGRESHECTTCCLIRSRQMLRRAAGGVSRRVRARELATAYGCHGRLGRRYRPAAALGVGLASTPAMFACGYWGDRRCGIHGGGFQPIRLIWRGANGNQCESDSTGRSTIHRSKQLSSTADQPMGTRSSWVDLVAEQVPPILSPLQAGTGEFCWQSSWQRCEVVYGIVEVSHVDIRTGRYRALRWGGYDLPQTARRHR